jgi:hypothetical protein
MFCSYSHCGKELSEDQYFTGICPFCHKALEPQQKCKRKRPSAENMLDDRHISYALGGRLPTWEEIEKGENNTAKKVNGKWELKNVKKGVQERDKQ